MWFSRKIKMKIEMSQLLILYTKYSDLLNPGLLLIPHLGADVGKNEDSISYWSHLLYQFTAFL